MTECSTIPILRWPSKSIGILHKLIMPLLSLLLVAGCTMLAPAQPIAPEAAHWQTWVLASSAGLRPAAPPDQAATQAEIAELKTLAAQRDTNAAALVAYWNTSSPTYRWVQITTDRYAALPPGPPNGRAMSHITVAMYDAMIAAWDAKYAYNRPRPSQVDPSLSTLLPPPHSPSYPSEHAVVAGAAAAMLAYLLPDEAALYTAKAEEAAHAQLLAGTQYPSDVEAGLALGRAVAAKVIERAKNDGSDAEWTGEVPTGPGYWIMGDRIFMPMAGTWQTWLLTSNDQLRPPPPPAYDSSVVSTALTEMVVNHLPGSLLRGKTYRAKLPGRLQKYSVTYALAVFITKNSFTEPQCSRKAGRCLRVDVGK